MSVSALVPFSAPENYRRVLRTVRQLWVEGAVEYSIHAVSQMRHQGLTDQDVASVIATGSVVEHNRPRGNWRWKVQGACVDGHSASCVVAIELDRHLLIVTVIDQATERGEL